MNRRTGTKKRLEERVLELRRSGRTAKAIALLSDHLQRSADDEDPRLALLLGELLSDFGEHERAAPVLQRIHDRFASGGDRVARGLAAAALAENLRRLRGAENQLRALELLREAEERLTRRAGLARCRIALAQGRIHLEQRDYPRAYARLSQASDLAGARSAERAAAARSLGLFFGAVGRTSLALRWFERALQTQEKTGDIAGQARSCGELGRLFLDRGEPAEARAIIRRGVSAGRKLADPYQLAHLLNDLGRAEAALGNSARARTLIEECLEVCRRRDLALVGAFAQKNLAKLLWRDGRPEPALERLDRQAVPRFRDLSNNFGLAVALRVRGRILRDLGRENEAMAALDEARSGFEAADALRQVAVTDCDRALLLSDRLRRRPDQSRLREQTVELLDGALSLARSLADPRLFDRIASLLEAVDLDAAVKRHVAFLAGRERESQAVVLGGHKEVLTVLAADLEGFTGYASGRDPQQVLDTLNQYFSAFGEVLEEHNGTVDKYIGDGLMVLFRGDTGGHHPYRAVRAALAMRDRLDQFNREQRVARGLPPLKTRIGINTGEVVVGNTGSYERMQFTAIGAPVNLAFRLEDSGAPDSVRVGPATFRHLGGHFQTRPVPPFVPKGLDHEVQAHEVIAERELVRFRARFVRPEKARPRAGSLLLGMGGRIVPGVVDRAADRCGSASIAARILREPYLVLDAFRGAARVQHAALELPRPPGFDEIVSAYFAQELIEHGVLPRGARELAEYLERVALLLLPDTPEPWNTPWGLVAGLFDRNRIYGTLPEEGDLYALKRGIYLAEFLCTLVAEGADLLDPELLGDDHPFEREGERVREEDPSRLEADLARAVRGTVRLPTRSTGRRKPVRYIALEAPRSVALWAWARQYAAGGDRRRRPGLLLVTRSGSRPPLLSLDPESGATLEPLRANLEHAEAEAGERQDRDRPGSGWIALALAGLPGVALEGPARGSALTPDEILAALERRLRRRA